jgi:hypothetical protein
MSEYCFDGRGAKGAREFPSEGPALAEYPPVLSVPMPFEPDSREADALRGALSFLFSLIAFYDELTGLDAPASDSVGGGDVRPH